MNTTLTYRTLALVAFCPVLGTLACNTASVDDYAWQNNEQDFHCDLVAGDKTLVRYMYAPLDDSNAERRAETYKPYLHVFSPDGFDGHHQRSRRAVSAPPRYLLRLQPH